MSSNVNAGKDLATETKPTLIFNNHRTFADQRLLTDRDIRIFITMRMVCNVDITGKEDILADFDAINGSEGIPDSYPASVTNCNRRMIMNTSELF